MIRVKKWSKTSTRWLIWLLCSHFTAAVCVCTVLKTKALLPERGKQINFHLNVKSHQRSAFSSTDMGPHSHVDKVFKVSH